MTVGLFAFPAVTARGAQALEPHPASASLKRGFLPPPDQVPEAGSQSLVPGPFLLFHFNFKFDV